MTAIMKCSTQCVDMCFGKTLPLHMLLCIVMYSCHFSRQVLLHYMIFFTELG